MGELLKVRAETGGRQRMEPQNDLPNVSLQDGSRRSFLGALLALASALVAALLAIPVLRYVFYPLTASSKPSGWSAAGTSSEATAASAPLSRTLDVRQQDGWLETD